MLNKTRYQLMYEKERSLREQLEAQHEIQKFAKVISDLHDLEFTDSEILSFLKPKLEPYMEACQKLEIQYQKTEELLTELIAMNHEGELNGW